VKHFKSLALFVVIAALAVVVIAPAAFASAGVSLKLKGPSSAANGATIKLTLTIKNPKRADGSSVAYILQNSNGHLRWIGEKGITWNAAHTSGTVVFNVKAKASAMGIAKYKSYWMHPMGNTYSNALNIPLN